jgi:hypothetical protein
MSDDSYGGQIVTAPFEKGTTANDKIFKLKPGELAYGNGCSKHLDCFTCPFEVCTWTSSQSYTAKGN